MKKIVGTECKKLVTQHFVSGARAFFAHHRSYKKGKAHTKGIKVRKVRRKIRTHIARRRQLQHRTPEKPQERVVFTHLQPQK
jgi:hypothetical protein